MLTAHLYTSTGCGYCAKIKDFLKEKGVPYEERDILVEPAWLDELAKYGIFGVPALIIGEETIVGYRPNKMGQVIERIYGAAPATVTAPAPAEQTAPAEAEIFVKDADREQLWDLIIIGGGPAGASAALYAARAGHSVLVLDRAPGAGALAITREIENYPGIKSATGPELLQAMQSHAREHGAVFLQAAVLSAKLNGTEKLIETGLGAYRSRAVIVATGARSRKGKIPGEQELEGRGVSYCAICDGAFTRGKEVIVYGDNEEALEEVSLIAGFAGKVRLLFPGTSLIGATEEDLARVPENVTLYPKHKITQILATEAGALEGARVATPEGEQVWEAGSVFIYVGGGAPGTSFLGDEVPLSPEGFLVTDESMATPVEGVFAAGDSRKSLVRQAVIAAADGALAAISADRFLRGRKRFMAQH